MGEPSGQKAPSAKRCIKTSIPTSFLVIWIVVVRKHRAPKGALRRGKASSPARRHSGQKAPSAKRCIKTLKPFLVLLNTAESESTERQKVH